MGRRALLKLRWQALPSRRRRAGSPRGVSVFRPWPRLHVLRLDVRPAHPLRTRVVRTTVRDATYVLDGILDNQIELPIEKHTTDTAGYSDIIFALFDLLGLQFAPRLAGLPDRRLYRLGSAGTTPAGQLLAHPLNLDVIRDGWDDLVRFAASLRDGTVTASLLVARLQAAGGKLPLTRALQEYGQLVKTRFVLGYLADETEPRDSAASRTKARACMPCTTAPSTATTAPSVCTRLSANRPRRTGCLVANAIVCWNTIYIQRVLDELGYEPAGDELGGLTPTLFEHVNLLGTYNFSSDRPAGQLRPLRTATAA